MAKPATKSKQRRASRQQRLQTRTQRVSQRREQQFLTAHPAYDPSQPLSGTRLAGAVGDLVNADLGPQLSAVDRQASTTATQGAALQRNVSGYYQQLAAEEAKRVAEQTAIGQRLDATLSQVGQQGAQANQNVANDAIGRVSSGDPGLAGDSRQRLAQEVAARAGNSAATAQAFQSAGAQQGADASSYQNALTAATGMRGGEQLSQFGNRTANTLRDLATKRADLQGQAGPLATKYLTQLRQQGIENAITQAGLGIKNDTLAAQVQQNQATNALAGQRIQTTAQANAQRNALGKTNSRIAAGRLGETTRHNQAQEATAAKNAQTAARKAAKTGGVSPTQQRAYSQQYDKAVAAAQTAKGHAPGGGLTDQDGAKLVAILVQRGIAKPLAQVAVRQHLGMEVGPGLQTQAKNLGVNVGTTGVAPQRKRRTQRKQSRIPGVAQVP